MRRKCRLNPTRTTAYRASFTCYPDLPTPMETQLVSTVKQQQEVQLIKPNRTHVPT